MTEREEQRMDTFTKRFDGFWANVDWSISIQARDGKWVVVDAAGINGARRVATFDTFPEARNWAKAWVNDEVKVR